MESGCCWNVQLGRYKSGCIEWCLQKRWRSTEFELDRDYGKDEKSRNCCTRIRMMKMISRYNVNCETYSLIVKWNTVRSSALIWFSLLSVGCRRLLSLLQQILPAVGHTAFVLSARATQWQSLFRHRLVVRNKDCHCSVGNTCSKATIRVPILTWLFNASRQSNKSTKVRTNLPRTSKYHATSYNPDHPCEPSRHPFVQRIVISCIINTSWSQKINASARHAYQGDIARSWMEYPCTNTHLFRKTINFNFDLLSLLTRERPCFPSHSASLSRPVRSIYHRRWECCQATFCQPSHPYQWLVMCIDSTDISTNEIIQSTLKRWQGCQSLSTTFSHFQTPIHFFGRVTAHESTSSNLIRRQVYLINALMHVQWCCDTRCVSVLWTRLSTWKSRWISTSHFLRFFLFLPFSKQVLFNFGTRLLVYPLS